MKWNKSSRFLGWCWRWSLIPLQVLGLAAVVVDRVEVFMSYCWLLLTIYWLYYLKYIAQCTYRSLVYHHINCKVPSPHPPRDPGGSQEILRMRSHFSFFLFSNVFQFFPFFQMVFFLRWWESSLWATWMWPRPRSLWRSILSRFGFVAKKTPGKYLDILNPRNCDGQQFSAVWRAGECVLPNRKGLCLHDFQVCQWHRCCAEG